ncbi:MAG: hypothetical protein ACI814_004722 [Mariniblastus sp.]|jgi:hypothetical protein
MVRFAESGTYKISHGAMAMEEKEFVRLLFVDTDVEANYFKTALEENKIHVLVKGLDDLAFGAALDGPDQIEMFVYADDFEQAKALIVDILDDDSDEIPAWTCKCGEDVDEGFGACWSCGADYVGESDAESDG